MPILFPPKAAIELVVPPVAPVIKGETETLFPLADRPNGSVTKEFDMKGALYAVFVQEADVAATGNTVLTLEVFDSERSDWKQIDPTTAFISLTPSDILVDQVGEGQVNALLMPSDTLGGTALLRAVLTTSGGTSKTTVVVIKINTIT